MKELRPYQRRAVQRGVQRNLLVEHACGLGKTITSIEIAKGMRARTDFRINTFLVVCKRGNREQWAEAISEQDPSATVEIWQTLDDWRQPEPGVEDLWVIIHYDIISKLLPVLQTRLWGVIIADEAHRIKNRKAKRAQGLKGVEGIRKIALTATPFDRNVADYWSILNWLAPENFRGYWPFRDAFVEVERTWQGYEKVVGIKNQEKLKKLLDPWVDQQTKESVAEELPPRIMQRIPVPLSTKHRRIYDQIRKSRDIETNLTELDEETGELLDLGTLLLPNALTRLIRLQQFTSDPQSLGIELPSDKIEWIREYISDAPSEKFVVFSRFRSTAIKLASELKSALVIGGVEEKLTEFRRGKQQVLVGTIAALCEGYDLPMADTAIFLDVDWSYIKMTQAIDRIHRLGTTTPKNIIYLYTPGTADELVLQALDNKWSTHDLVVAAEKEA